MNVTKLLKRKRWAQRVGNVKVLAEVVKELGDIYFETERLEEALQEYMEQLELCETLNDKLNCAVAHRMIGEVYVKLGDYEQALVHQNLYLDGAQETENLLEQQRAYATLGRIYFCLAESLPEGNDNKQEALLSSKKAYTKSIRICQKLEDTDIKMEEIMLMRARLLLNLGLILEGQGEQNKGIKLIENAAELCTIHKFHEDLHRTHIALGALYERQGNIELAIEYIDKAINTIDPIMKAEASLTKAEILLRIGKWQEARKILVSLYTSNIQAETIRQQIDKLLRIAVTLCRTEESLDVEVDVKTRQKHYEVLGDAAVAAKAYEKAIDYYREMLACAERTGEDVSAALVSLSRTLRDAGRCAEAVIFARRELELCSTSREMCQSALYLAEILTAANFPDSEIREAYELARSEAKKCDSPQQEATVLKEILEYLVKTEKLDEAEDLKLKLNLLDVKCESDSEDEPETPDIGLDICLEDLSDVEDQLPKNTNSRNNRRLQRGIVVKRNEKGETQLHVACINGNVTNVEKLLEGGHPTNVKDNCGWTPLHEAANHGHIEIAELLLKAGADVNDPGGALCCGVTPLHDAAVCGNFSMMSLLLKHNADASLRTTQGETVLDCLVGWRNRVEDLSPSEQAEYEKLKKKLSVIVPPSSERPDTVSTSSKSAWHELLDEEQEEEYERPKKISAGEDYKRTIANLRNRGGVTAMASRPSETQKITAPLLDSEQLLIDDWLEDDMREESTSRTHYSDNLPNFSKRKSSNSISDQDKNTKRQRLESEDSNDAVSLLDDNSCDSNSSEIVSISNRTKRPGKNRSRQVSLLTAGFTRDSTSRTPSPMTSSTSQHLPQQSSRSVLINLQVSVDHKIFDMKIKLPEQENKTIANITDDIKKKFEDCTGCQVNMNLTTINGDSLSPDATMDSLIANGNTFVLKSQVIDMQIPPIVERYKVVCSTLNIGVQDSMIKCLRICENTSTVRLNPNETLPEELTPFLKSLEYQKPLQVLHLSGITLFHFGDLLNSSLMQLISLQELHMRGCDIDYNCLFQIDKLPLQLKILDLSYNILGSESEGKLYQLLAPLKCLQTLNLCSCELQDLPYAITSNALVNLDVSWNNLGGEGVDKFLQRQMLSLNLSNTLERNKSPVITVLLNNFATSLYTLESLELACCHIQDSDVDNILSKCPNLARLVLNGNSNLTKCSVIAALKHVPTLTYIDISGCTEISDEPEPEVTIQNPEVCTLMISMEPKVQSSWLVLWKDSGIVKSLPYNVAIFKSIL
ncbi:tonsoku-like protein [Cephus cinctus]|uniref:Tonsoku-like protein n=1 Tax=Cephus cinctus TaxID=211228 RepID=A0AAJ7FJT1_CEPCN|nr:tonsoku-like protein [Cephus cinctus]